jgi:hypothetical protein
MDNTIKQVEETLFRDASRTGNPFQMSQAELYLLAGESFRLVAQDVDVYDLLAGEYGNEFADADFILVATCGWAAPADLDSQDEADEGVAPSQHPKRRRVRLSVGMDRNGGMASVLRFQDSSDEPLYDQGAAHGSLAVALAEFWFAHH